MTELTSIEVVRDVSEGSRLDEGFLRLRRLVLRNRYADGTASREYAYDVVSRRQPDAVAVAVHGAGPDGTPHVALRRGPRPPVWLRRDRALVQPDDREHLLLPEIVAGLLEDDDAGPGGIERRAARECLEEAGFEVDPAAVEPLGGPVFPTPGITDEKVHLRAVRVDLARRTRPRGDGSVGEEAGDVWVLPLDEAIRRCRSGEIPDMKTEIALLRLRDRLRGPAPHAGGRRNHQQPQP